MGLAFLVTVLALLMATRWGLAGLGSLWQHSSDQPATRAQPITAPAPITPDTTDFDPAYLIADDVFYNTAAMSEQEVADFITRVNSGCMAGSDGTPCLAQATFDTATREPTRTCPGGYEGAAGETAATIIWKVSQSCGINPQVLLTLIQKEQGLLTASGASLTAHDYTSAAGYACPDGTACDPAWSGFFLQIYGAASQFQRYRLEPATFRFRAGFPAHISYSPDPGCGSAPLTPRNEATAALYNYTPYQPNPAVPSGGDDCSSWGNWNFYGFFRTLFGDPTP